MADRDFHSKPCACCFAWSDLDFWAFRLCVKCHDKIVAFVGVPPNNARWEPDANAAQAQWKRDAEAALEKVRVH